MNDDFSRFANMADAKMTEFTELADLNGAIALQAGTLADMNLVAAKITAD